MTLGGVAGGPSWTNWPLGIIRVTYPFLAGVALSRIHSTHLHGRGTNPAIPVIALVLIFIAPIPTQFNWIYEFTCVAAAIPALIYFSAKINLTRWAEEIGKTIGDLSYPIYVIHYPIVKAIFGFARSKGWATPTYAPQLTATIAISSIAGAWLLLKLYDEPVRKWLMARYGQRR